MACGCCELNRIKKLFEEKRKKEAEVAKALEEKKEVVVEEAEVKPIAKPRKKKVEIKEEKILEEEESL